METYGEILNQKVTINFPQEMGVFGVTTVHGGQRREFALHPGYTKLNIFGKLKHKALE